MIRRWIADLGGDCFQYPGRQLCCPFGLFELHRGCEGKVENKADVTLFNLAGDCRGPVKFIQELSDIFADLGADFVDSGMKKLSGFGRGSKVSNQLWVVPLDPEDRAPRVREVTSSNDSQEVLLAELSGTLGTFGFLSLLQLPFSHQISGGIANTILASLPGVFGKTEAL